MLAEHSIACDQTELFNRTLGEQKAIKRIPRRRLRIDRFDGVVMIDGEEVQSNLLQIVGEIVEGKARIDLSEPGLYGDFPKARCTREQDVIVRAHGGSQLRLHS